MFMPYLSKYERRYKVLYDLNKYKYKKYWCTFQLALYVPISLFLYCPERKILDPNKPYTSTIQTKLRNVCLSLYSTILFVLLLYQWVLHEKKIKLICNMFCDTRSQKRLNSQSLSYYQSYYERPKIIRPNSKGQKAHKAKRSIRPKIWPKNVCGCINRNNFSAIFTLLDNNYWAI